MGLFALFKANLCSTKKQKKISSAMQAEDSERTNILIAGTINEMLRTDLTKNQLSILKAIKSGHNESLTHELLQAFHRGWINSDNSNLSNAMDEVLRSVQEAIKAQEAIDEYRKQFNKENKKQLKSTRIQWHKHKNTTV
ncbi:MAG: hypothetical protein ACUZ8H_05945 [Candidatus Anammoxibacter sp.]